jgi:hypothetical protein
MGSGGRRHPFELLDYHGDPGEPVEIDAEIVPLIKEIWALGFDTELSCQDHDGYVWVELPGRHAQRLLNVIAGEVDELRANILGLAPIAVGPDQFEAYQREHAWRYSVMAVADPGLVWLSVRILFPRDQLAAVVVALERASRPEAA